MHVEGLGFKVWGLGFRVQGLGVEGLGFRVQGVTVDPTSQVSDFLKGSRLSWITIQ